VSCHDVWEKVLQKYVVVKEVGENEYHDVPTHRNMKFEDIIEACLEDRLEITDNAGVVYQNALELNDEASTYIPTVNKIRRIISGIMKKDANDFLIRRIGRGVINVSTRIGSTIKANKFFSAMCKFINSRATFTSIVTPGKYEVTLTIYAKPGNFHMNPDESMAGEPPTKMPMAFMAIRGDVWDYLSSTNYTGLTKKKIQADITRLRKFVDSYKNEPESMRYHLCKLDMSIESRIFIDGVLGPMRCDRSPHLLVGSSEKEEFWRLVRAFATAMPAIHRLRHMLVPSTSVGWQVDYGEAHVRAYKAFAQMAGKGNKL